MQHLHKCNSTSETSRLFSSMCLLASAAAAGGACEPKPQYPHHCYFWAMLTMIMISQTKSISINVSNMPSSVRHSLHKHSFYSVANGVLLHNVSCFVYLLPIAHACTHIQLECCVNGIEALTENINGPDFNSMNENQFCVFLPFLSSSALLNGSFEPNNSSQTFNGNFLFL